jgi:hypothetical protein
LEDEEMREECFFYNAISLCRIFFGIERSFALCS